MLHRVLVLTITFAFVLVLRADDEEEAVTVFDAVGPSVVALESGAASGTGVIIHESGLILTNAHVVNVPLKTRCLVDVLKNGKTETVVFQSTKIVGLHTKLDLALVKIDPAEHPAAKIKPAVLNKEPLRTGRRVYAIGNPGGGGKVKLNKTVTSGLLSGVDREIDGANYLQISAAINSGNSGGPLCDKSGKVIGIVTLKLNDAENVGFALPTAGLKMEEFKERSAARVVSREEAEKRLAAARDLMSQTYRSEAYRRITAEQARELRAVALAILQDALSWDSTNGDIYAQIATALSALGEHDRAEEYLAVGLEHATWGSSPALYRVFGAELNLRKRPDEALAMWWEGLAKFPEDDSLWRFVGKAYEAQSDWYEQARCEAAVHVLLSKRTSSLPPPKLPANLAGDALLKAQIDVARMPDEVFRRMLRRDLYLKQNRTTLTQPFADLIGKRGWKVSNEGSKPKPYALDVSRLTDFIPLVKAGGEWKAEGGTLSCSAQSFARAEAETAVPPDEYDLVLEAERLSGRGPLLAGLLINGKPAAVAVDQNQTTVLAGLSTPSHRGPTLLERRPVSLVLQVRKSEVTLRVNQRVVWSIPAETTIPVPPEKWRGKSGTPWFIGAEQGSFAVHGWWLMRPSNETTVARSQLVSPSPPAFLPPPQTSPNNPTLPRPAALGAFQKVSPGALGFREVGRVKLEEKRMPLCLAMSPDGKYAACCDQDAVWIYNIDKKKKVFEFDGIAENRGGSRMVFTPQGDKLIVGCGSGLVRVWNFQDGLLESRRDYKGHAAKLGMTCLAVSPDGEYVISGCLMERVHCWELKSLEKKHDWPVTNPGPNSVHFAPDGKSAVLTDGRTLTEVDLESGTSASRNMKSLLEGLPATAFRADGAEFVHVDKQGVFRRRRVADFGELGMCDAGINVHSLRYSPDGKKILSGVNGAVLIWDAETAAPLDYLVIDSPSEVRLLAMSLDGRRIAAASMATRGPLQIFETKAP